MPPSILRHAFGPLGRGVEGPCCPRLGPCGGAMCRLSVSPLDDMARNARNAIPFMVNSPHYKKMRGGGHGRTEERS
jgi:hypothetical protein